MKKYFLVFIACISVFAMKGQNIYMTSGGKASFFSATPVEDIDAHSSALNCILNTSTNDVVYSVLMTSFKFVKPLMQEHFNEKYVESDKYPKAVFKGKINEKIDYTKDGTYDITATGNLEVHGVAKPYTEKGKLTIKDGVISIEGSFDVKLVDHKIEVPTLVATNIAETINIKHAATLAVFKKK